MTFVFTHVASQHTSVTKQPDGRGAIRQAEKEKLSLAIVFSLTLESEQVFFKEHFSSRYYSELQFLKFTLKLDYAPHKPDAGQQDARSITALWSPRN